MKKRLLSLSILLAAFAAHAQYGITSYDIYPGFQTSTPMGLTTYAGHVYFYANDSVHGQELWRVNENSAPAMVADIHPGNLAFAHAFTDDRRPISVFKEELYFWGYDGKYYGPYKLNTTGGPTLTVDLLPLYPGFVNGAIMAPLPEQLFFAGVYNYNGQQLWRYKVDGNEAKKVTSLVVNDNTITDIIGFQNKVYFTSRDRNKHGELYVHDPVADTTLPLQTIWPGFVIQDANTYTVINNRLYFYGTAPMIGAGIFMYDGISAPRCISVNSQVDVAAVGALREGNTIAAYHDMVYYVARTSDMYYQLVQYNPVTGKSAVAYKSTVKSIDIQSLCVYNDKLFFSGSDAAHGRELWQYDGTTAMLAADVNPGPDDSDPLQLTTQGNSLFFTAFTDAGGYELFKFTDIPASVAGVNKQINIALHPNPTHDAATLEISLQQSQTLEVTLTDAQGRTVHTIPSKQYNAGTQRITLPMQSLPTGMYYYRVSNGNAQLASGKVMKE